MYLAVDSLIDINNIKSGLNNITLGTVNVKDTLKAFNDFKNKQKRVWSKVFWYMKVCIFLKCIQYTIHRDQTQNFLQTK